MTNPSDPSSPHGAGAQGSYPAQPAPGSWPAQGASSAQGAPPQGAPQHQPPQHQPPQGAPPQGAPQQPPPGAGRPETPGGPGYPGGPASPRAGLRGWHLVVAAVVALVLGGAGGFAGGFYGLGGGVTGAETQDLRDRVAELEGQVTDLEEELAAGEGVDDASSDDASTGDAGGSPVLIGVPAGWQESVAATHVWVQVLEELGYAVELMEIPDVGALYMALAAGEVDMTLGTWGADSQDYIDQNGADLEDLGSWFDEARMGIVVNEDAPITSLAELADHADEFNGEIIGIEEGSGVVQGTNQGAVPAYGLDDFTVQTGSTQDMLRAVAEAIDSGENVAATLWSPHWALDELPVRFLEDPEAAFGEPAAIHAYGTAGFAADHPELAECLAEISLTPEQVNSMVNTVIGTGGQGDPSAAQEWLASNPDVTCAALG